MKEWNPPVLEVLDVSMTMKGWGGHKPPKGPKPPEEDPIFDS